MFLLQPPRMTLNIIKKVIDRSMLMGDKVTKSVNISIIRFSN